MKTLRLFLGVMLVPLVLSDKYRGSTKNEDYRLNSITGVSEAAFGGCRKRHPENRRLTGGAEACASHKPLKIKGIEKMGKRLCASGYEYCSVAHKSLHHLSWKSEAMPKSCFGFHYRKDKFAGYGHNCHRNLYFDGLLCCPSHGHNLKTDSRNKIHHRRHLKNKN